MIYHSWKEKEFTKQYLNWKEKEIDRFGENFWRMKTAFCNHVTDEVDPNVNIYSDTQWN